MQKRILGLDIVRAAAIIMVVISHCFLLLLPLSTAPYGIGWLAGKLIAITIPFGILGVELFFVLSGYLVGTILIKQFMQQEIFGFKQIKSFWIRRWFRTLPNYYLVLIINILLYSYLQGENMFHWKFFFFGQNLFSVPINFFAESWSLSIEEWFYITMPLAILFSSFFFKKMPKQKILLGTLLVYLLIFFVTKIVHALTYNYQVDTSESFAFAQSKTLRKIVMYRLDAICFGVLVAYINYFSPAQLFKWRKPIFIIGFISSCILILLHYLGTYPGVDLYNYKYFKVLSNAFLYLLIPFFFSCLLPCAASIPTIGNKTLEKVIIYISTISYSIYLVHLSLIYNPLFSGLKTATAAGAFLNSVLYLLLVSAVSSLLYFLYEKPMTTLRNKLK